MRKGKGKGGGGEEPVDKHLRPQFRPLVKLLSCQSSVSKIIICQSILHMDKSEGNERCFAPSENRVKWSASVIVHFAKRR